MITPREAWATAPSFLNHQSSRCRVVAIHEDAVDYFAVLDCEWPQAPGPGFLFVSKATGEPWWGTPITSFTKIDNMVRIPLFGPHPAK